MVGFGILSRWEQHEAFGGIPKIGDTFVGFQKFLPCTSEIDWTFYLCREALR
jgi:hypothetical protein